MAHARSWRVVLRVGTMVPGVCAALMVPAVLGAALGAAPLPRPAASAMMRVHPHAVVMSGSAEAVEPELSRPLFLSRLSGRKAHRAHIDATEAECEALAKRFDLEAVHELAADVTVRRTLLDSITIRGNLTALIGQVCVVSNEPFANPVAASFACILHADESRISEDAIANALGEEEVVDEDVLDDPEVLDLGEVVAQYLYLNVDQFPKKPGSRFKPPPGVRVVREEDVPGGGGDEEGSATFGSMFPDVLPDDLS